MYRYKVIKNRLLTPTIRSVTLRAENNKAFLFEPGQYVAISMRRNGRPTTTRCFSIASSPRERRSLEICTRVKGKYTTAMKNLTIGDTVMVRGPFGHFVFNEEEQESLVLFAGGIGITPFMSMIRYAEDLQLTNDIRLVYSCRNQEDIPFLEELLSIKEKNSHFHLTFIIGGGETSRLRNSDVIIGRIDETILQKLGLNFLSETYMVCGPAPYIKTIRAMLSSRKIPSVRILSEAFSQGKHEQSDTMKRWPFNAYALAGLSFSLAVLLITASDFLKTLPTLKNVYQAVPAKTVSVIKSNGIGVENSVTAIKPQVSTDISQKPIIRQVSVTGTTTKVVTPAPSPAAITLTPTPTPTLTPPSPKTVTPTVRPKTRVS